MSKEQGAIERLEYLEHVLGHTMIQAGEIIGKQGKYNLANDIKTVLNMLKEKDKEINRKSSTIKALQCALHERTEERDRKDYIIARQKKQIDLIKEYVHQEVVHYTESISDYIDDSKEENRHIIGELKEEREHWKDIDKILQNKEKDELYMNWWKYGLYE